MLDTTTALEHWKGSKAGNLDLSPILHAGRVRVHGPGPVHCTGTQDHGLDKALDQQLIVSEPQRTRQG